MPDIYCRYPKLRTKFMHHRCVRFHRIAAGKKNRCRDMGWTSDIVCRRWPSRGAALVATLPLSASCGRVRCRRCEVPGPASPASQLSATHLSVSAGAEKCSFGILMTARSLAHKAAPVLSESDKETPASIMHTKAQLLTMAHRFLDAVLGPLGGLAEEHSRLLGCGCACCDVVACRRQSFD